MKLIARILLALMALLLLVSVAAPAANGAAPQTYHYYVGTGPVAGPDSAADKRGDHVELTGEGNLHARPNAATGGGTFRHVTGDGTVLATGTWAIERLLSFHDYGPASGPGLPDTAVGGRAWMRIHLLPEGNPKGFDALITITSARGDKAPGSALEGVTLNPFALLNFKQPISGDALFVKTTPVTPL